MPRSARAKHPRAHTAAPPPSLAAAQVLTVEHAKVKKMLLADKDHELQEYEYQWGVAKANMAASAGELMIVDEEVSILKGLVTQTHRYHLQQSRTGKLPADLLRQLTLEQLQMLEQLQ